LLDRPSIYWPYVASGSRGRAVPRQGSRAVVRGLCRLSPLQAGGPLPSSLQPCNRLDRREESWTGSWDHARAYVGGTFTIVAHTDREEAI